MFKFLKSKFSDNKAPYIKWRSNVIQYDDMGYPLRLVINYKDEQEWLDTYEKEGDVVLKWNEVAL